jgi:hypothetical protein
MGGICLLAILFITPVHAAISDIPAGGTVFIGEEGLDITACGVGTGDTLGWFPAGATPATGNPGMTIQVSDATSFYVEPPLPLWQHQHPLQRPLQHRSLLLHPFLNQPQHLLPWQHPSVHLH